ncbi:monovalent cation:proton antiporter-2 (CPA2) family protein [Azoarcus sp. KH32C]|uniref:monovalent cation:proton antiporter-2 (CPA2) family protein n=1 Tax=Azoarcus sp. KH32C TaxID=748247 RepID=UPI0002386354|nr:monovalent cation:proton antiporter-2 (CPA2) family protein [Azoarcus sp. KH32C]BAL22499.1 putative glutathione-regulated potassium-efflux system protein [Azoarcus sp. KH32C]
MLTQTAFLLLAAVILIPLAKRVGLGAVLGYLVAGVLLGPWGLGVIRDVEAILHFGEFGVVLLLFVIGLELRPSRLWVLRRPVFGLGSLQVGLTALALAALAMAFGLDAKAAVVIGLGGAMSSTAMVLQSLAERNQLSDRHGRDAFAILLFQDMAVIPVLAVLPLLGGGGADFAPLRMLGAAAAIAGVVLAGRVLLRPVFTWIATLGSRETFTAAALLVVIATTLLMEGVGLSASLGAFLAGVVLADSEYRHELEADLDPFKGLLLGVFFMAVGMGANLGLLVEAPGVVVGLAACLIALKLLVVFVVGRGVGRSAGSARKLAIALAQGGEFAFVVFQLAGQQRLLDAEVIDAVTVAVTISMLLWPLLFLFEERVLARIFRTAQPRPFDRIRAQGNPVIIAGFGRVGQIVARVLALKRIAFTVLEADPQQVDYVRRFGNEVYFGDASRPDLLRAAGAADAHLFVLAIDDVEASLRTADVVRRHFPDLAVIARARNRYHAYKLMDLGVEAPIRETWHGSLALAEDLLGRLGVPQAEARRTVERFASHDEASLKRQHAIYQDEAKLVASVQQAREELRSLFERDEAELDGGETRTESVG